MMLRFRFPHTLLPLTLTTAALFSTLLSLSPNAQANPLTSNQPFQQSEQYDWKIFPHAIPQLSSDRDSLDSMLTNAEALWGTLERNQFDQSVQFVGVPAINNLGTTPLSAQRLPSGDSRTQD